MQQLSIGCDAHKHYSQIEVQDPLGQVLNRLRIDHHPGALQSFFCRFPADTPVALESVGNWYWIADEIEAAGCTPLLTHPAKAKLMMGHINKTDKLDAAGLATLLRIGSLPTVWLPPAEIRDDRELPRTRMTLCRMRTSLKNRIHSILAKYALSPEDGSQLFSQKGRAWLDCSLSRLPAETRRCLSQHLELLDSFSLQISALEERIRSAIALTPRMQLLKSLPGVGDILAIVIDREIGTISRFPSAPQFSSYCGTTPRVSSSGGKTHYGKMRTESNQYLKWAFIEAANAVSAHHAQRGWVNKYVSKLYLRIRGRKGSSIAIGAVARHLAESAFWVLSKNVVYREPKQVSPRQGESRD
jgi:transposase